MIHDAYFTIFDILAKDGGIMDVTMFLLHYSFFLFWETSSSEGSVYENKRASVVILCNNVLCVTVSMFDFSCLI